MNKKIAGLIILIFFGLSGCARFDLGGQNQQSLPQISPNVSVSQAISLTQIKNFIGAEVANLLSEKEQAEAVNAQFNALQFSRPGVFRNWKGEIGVNGEMGATGKVSVGPYVRVNDLDCREFEHIVIIKTKKYSSSGTACREVNGSWSVV